MRNRIGIRRGRSSLRQKAGAVGLIAGLALAGLAMAGLSFVAGPVPQAAAALGGPVILGGDDLQDHGSRDTTANVNVDGWLYLQKAIQNVAPLVNRAGNDGTIAALGSTDSTATGGDGGAAIHWAAQDAGKSVTYYDGGPAIDGFFNALRAGTAKPAIIWIAGTGASNTLDGIESTSLANNATTIGDFVNSAGGLISHGTEYAWLSGLLPGATINTPTGSGSGDLELTPAGTAAFPGLTNADVNAGPWHGYFDGNLGGLGALVESNVQLNAAGQRAPVIIGGSAVTLPGSITLDPPTAQRPIGSTHTVTATVRNSSGGLRQGAVVTFNVISGPNAGTTGTGTTDANGQATFTWTDTGGAGTDTIQASFVDEASNTRSTTATVDWSNAVTTTTLAGGATTTTTIAGGATTTTIAGGATTTTLAGAATTTTTSFCGAQLTVSPRTVTAGQAISVVGDCLPPNTDVTVTLDGVVLGVVRTGADGRFTAAFTIPVNTTQGGHTISATGGGRFASASITVVGPGGAAVGGAAASAAGSGKIAVTGSGDELRVVLAIALFFAGFVLLAGKVLGQQNDDWADRL